MNNNGLNENTVFNEMEILEIFIDLLYRNLDSDTKVRSSFDSINREVSDFFGIPQKSYIGQLLYIISDVDHIRRSFVDHIEFYYQEMNRKVKRVVGVSLAIEIVQNVHFLEEFDVVMIENIEEFYNSTDAIQKKLARILESYLETGGKLLVTGCEFDNSKLIKLLKKLVSISKKSHKEFYSNLLEQVQQTEPSRESYARFMATIFKYKSQ
ncbi:hypothetical protein ACS6ZA_11465 [Streptococcus suis]